MATKEVSGIWRGSDYGRPSHQRSFSALSMDSPSTNSDKPILAKCCEMGDAEVPLWCCVQKMLPSKLVGWLLAKVDRFAEADTPPPMP
eukprot:c9159_g2_i1 orf=3-263(-)